MEKLYKITGKTNRWIAQRVDLFAGRECITITNNLPLRKAQQVMLKMFNFDFNTAYDNWELVLKNHSSVSWSCCDGTRGYEYDSRFYSIEEQKGVEAENYGIV